MTPEQFTQVVEAILEGKYSWACVLILRFAGYNPLHYIPYRTYNRLMKDNNQARSHNKQNQHRQTTAKSSSEKQFLDRFSEKVRDLSYLEPVAENASNIQGGTQLRWGQSFCHHVRHNGNMVLHNVAQFLQ